MSILEDERVTLELTLAARMGLAALLGFLMGSNESPVARSPVSARSRSWRSEPPPSWVTALALAILECNRLPVLRGLHRRVTGRPDMDDEDQT